ncbi:hypothetical protein BOG92_007385 [Streptomyces sp. WAC00263]|nr:hypothetical protein BOG92_007385 [Streptomyces sp. WAC00263]
MALMTLSSFIDCTRLSPASCATKVGSASLTPSCSLDQPMQPPVFSFLPLYSARAGLVPWPGAASGSPARRRSAAGLGQDGCDLPRIGRFAVGD